MNIQPIGTASSKMDQSPSSSVESQKFSNSPIQLNQEKSVGDQQGKGFQIPVNFHDHSLNIFVGEDKEIHVKVIDNQTGQIVREIPAKSAMQLISDWTGIWVDIKA